MWLTNPIANLFLWAFALFVPAAHAVVYLEDTILPIAGLDLSYEHYSNWAGTVNHSEPFLTLYPRSSEQVAQIANWAYKNHRHVRVQGFKHTFSPLLLGQDDDPAEVVILDLRRHMTHMELGQMRTTTTTARGRGTGTGKTLKTVTAQTGVPMLDFFQFCGENGVSVTNAPVIGDATLGGVLAIGGHGQATPVKGESAMDGMTFGSLSNTILSLKAIVWEEEEEEGRRDGAGGGKFIVKTFSRAHQDIGPFLVHIGRAVVTEVSLMVMDDYNLRMVSYTDVPRQELFSTSTTNSSSLRTFTSFMDKSGMVDALLYTFTDTPWLRIFSVEERKPRRSKLVTEPFPFSAFYGRPLTSPPTLGPETYRSVVAGLRETGTRDVWGASRNLLLNMNMPPTPAAFHGWVVVTARSNVQRVGKEMTSKFVEMTEEYKARGQFPVEQLIELRATGLDTGADVFDGAVNPTISPIRPDKRRPEWDTAVWMNTFTTAGAAASGEFGRRFEDWAYRRFSGGDAIVRPEWSKLWGYTDRKGPSSNANFLRETIPAVIGVEEWNQAVGTLDRYDPHQVFTNRFLRELMVPYVAGRGDEEGLALGEHFGGGGGWGWSRRK